jgi:hypothetical protein
MMVIHMRRRNLLAGLALGSGCIANADADSYGDGVPDFLRLTSRSDQAAFRGWFVWLARAMFERQPDIPAEIGDCSGLLRFCFHEALRPHTAEWAASHRLKELPPLQDVQKVRYPIPRLGAALFRVRPGPYRDEDASSGAFREFADAEHLMRHNCHRATGLTAALAGDLLFFKQLTPKEPYHSMIADPPFAVYHTGGKELRRPMIAELARHPEPRWRPVPGNSNFLGVYRWNILRDPS